MSHPHKEKMNIFAHFYPNVTVFTRPNPNNHWLATNNPSWVSTEYMVVSKEYQELAYQFLNEGIEVERKSGEFWVTDSEPDFLLPNLYRAKEKEVFCTKGTLFKSKGKLYLLVKRAKLGYFLLNCHSSEVLSAIPRDATTPEGVKLSCIAEYLETSVDDIQLSQLVGAFIPFD